jgi:uncharacterized damage-inducible protein DinB
MTNMTLTTERTDLLAMLADQRNLFRIAVSGISDDNARRRTTASELTLGGLLRHVSNCEKHWVRVIVERDETAEIDLAAIGDEYSMGADVTVEGLLSEWEAIVARTEAIIGSVPNLDDLVPLPTAPWSPEREWWTVRRIVLHIFREIAHHSGHADIIRESLDGANTTYKRAGIDSDDVAGWA